MAVFEYVDFIHVHVVNITQGHETFDAPQCLVTLVITNCSADV